MASGAVSRSNAVVAAVTGVLALGLVLCCGAGVAAVWGPPSVPGPGSSATGRSAGPSRSPGHVAVPDVVGKRLPEADRAVRAAGFTSVDVVDASGRGRLVLNAANWVVSSQRPAAGRRVAARSTVTLRVRKPSDDGSAGPVTRFGVVPAVVCRDLQTAQDRLRSAGYYNLRSEDATGQGRFQVMDRNWVVLSQSLRPGVRAGLLRRVVLRVVKVGEPTAGRCP